jgi:hypothetical protein
VYCKSLVDIAEIGVKVGDPIFVQPDLPNNQVKIEHFDTNIRISRKSVQPIQQREWFELKEQRMNGAL